MIAVNENELLMTMYQAYLRSGQVCLSSLIVLRRTEPKITRLVKVDGMEGLDKKSLFRVGVGVMTF